MANVSEELKRVDKEYKELFDIEIKKLKEIGVDDNSINEFIKWAKNNPIDISEIDPDFNIQEQFMNLRKVTWNRIRVLIVEKFGIEEYGPIYDYIAEKIAKLIKMILTGLFDMLHSNIDSLVDLFKYKNGKNSQQLAIAIIIKSLSFDYVEKAYLGFIKFLYKALIKYFLYNKELKNDKNLEKHYMDFLQLYNSKINQHSSRLEREFDSWLYDWDNLGKIAEKYIDTNDIEEFNKTLSKKYAGDII